MCETVAHIRDSDHPCVASSRDFADIIRSIPNQEVDCSIVISRIVDTNNSPVGRGLNLGASTVAIIYAILRTNCRQLGPYISSKV